MEGNALVSHAVYIELNAHEPVDVNIAFTVIYNLLAHGNDVAIGENRVELPQGNFCGFVAKLDNQGPFAVSCVRKRKQILAAVDNHVPHIRKAIYPRTVGIRDFNKRLHCVAVTHRRIRHIRHHIVVVRRAEAGCKRVKRYSAVLVGGGYSLAVMQQGYVFAACV